MERNIRTFIGIPVQLPVSYLKIVQRLKSRYPDEHLRWVPVENQHITLRFLGDISPVEVDRIKDLFDAHFKDIPSKILQVQGLGFFGRGNYPKVLWVGIQDHPIFLDLHQRALELEGIIRPDKEKGTLHPHITIARIGRRGVSDGFRSAVEDMSQLEPSMIKPERVVFYKSILSTSGSTYEPICEHVFPRD